MTYKGSETAGPPRPAKKRHIFAAAVLALQAFFIIWLAVGAKIGVILVAVIWVAADGLAAGLWVVARLAREWREDLG